MKDYNKAKKMLNELIETATLAIQAIEENQPAYMVCDLGVEKIDELKGEIDLAILGNCSSIINGNGNIIH